MIRISQLKVNIGHSGSELKKCICHRLRILERDLVSYDIVRQSLDARDKGNIRYVYTIDAETVDESRILARFRKDSDINPTVINDYKLPLQGDEVFHEPPYIIGSGPAGLFCAYFLAREGYRPVLIEQGQDVDSRTETVEDFFAGRKPLNPMSNVQFGEGGAGTFSDGKLNSGVKDILGRKTLVLKTFAAHGAPDSITYSAKPHVGTDVLRRVVKSMRQEIIKNGGTVLFNSRFVDFSTENGAVSAVNVETAEGLKTFKCSALVLAIGHSSRDTFKLLMDKGIHMEAKPFAVGVRCEHCQDSINKAQYGEDYRKIYGDKLPAADYKLTCRNEDGHAVYSFCMCPGGYVVNSSSEEGRLCVNGMSYSGRDGINANSAIIVSVSPDDIDAAGDPAKAIEFQRGLEEMAYRSGAGDIPIQRLEDFINNKETVEVGGVYPQTKGQTKCADLNAVLPDFIARNLKEAFPKFGKMISGFDDPDTILSAVETRTSSPVKIVRNERMQCSVRGIYPCGEGAGYAGGITSSAIDGIKVFEEIYRTGRLE